MIYNGEYQFEQTMDEFTLLVNVISPGRALVIVRHNPSNNIKFKYTNLMFETRFGLDVIDYNMILMIGEELAKAFEDENSE